MVRGVQRSGIFATMSADHDGVANQSSAQDFNLAEEEGGEAI